MASPTKVAFKIAAPLFLDSSVKFCTDINVLLSVFILFTISPLLPKIRTPSFDILARVFVPEISFLYVGILGVDVSLSVAILCRKAGSSCNATGVDLTISDEPSD